MFKLDPNDSTIVIDDNGTKIQEKDTTSAQATVDRMNTTVIDIPALKTSKLESLKEYINTQKKDFEEPYSEISIASFADKRKEAFAWSIDSTVATPYADMLSTDSAGVLDTTARDALLNAILAKITLIAQLEAFEDVSRTAIKLATTQAELDAIVIP